MGCVDFQMLPVMPKTKKDVPKNELAELRVWKETVGGSVRQMAVRNLTTKEKPGTLPYWIYELVDSDPVPYQFTTTDPSTFAIADSTIQRVVTKQVPILIAKRCVPLTLVLVYGTEKYIQYIQSPHDISKFMLAGEVQECRDSLKDGVVINDDYNLTDDDSQIVLQVATVEELMAFRITGTQLVSMKMMKIILRLRLQLWLLFPQGDAK